MSDETKKEFHGVLSAGTGFKLCVLDDSDDTSPKAPKSDVPCLGVWHEGLDGREFDCDYYPTFGCEDCVVNGGDRDPRQESADASIIEDFKDNKGELYDGVKFVAWRLGYAVTPQAALEANGKTGEWCLEGIRDSVGQTVTHEFEGIVEPEAPNAVAALRMILSEPPFDTDARLQAVAARIAPVKSVVKSAEVKP